MITDFELEIIPPKYTSIKAYQQKNVGDISAPEGSTVIWKWNTDHVDEIKLKTNDQVFIATHYSNGFGIKLILKNTSAYQLLYRNEQSPYLDSQQYFVSLLKDENPMISVQEFKDSIHDIVYYAGDVSDDYGVTAIYMMVHLEGKNMKYSIPVAKSKNASFSFSTQKIFNAYPKGSEFSYYFEVWDNDAVHGSKSTRTQVFQYKKLTETEIQKQLEKNSSDIKTELQQGMKDAKILQKQLEDARKKLLEKSSLDFNDKKSLEDLIQKQRELQNTLEKIRQEMQRNFEKKNDLTNQEKDILTQQQQLKEMMEQMKNPEYEELLKKIEELMDRTDKRQMMNTIEQMDTKSEKMEKNMDRLLQIFKNLDYKQKVNDDTLYKHHKDK
jgi:hypothetical protein